MSTNRPTLAAGLATASLAAVLLAGCVGESPDVSSESSTGASAQPTPAPGLTNVPAGRSPGASPGTSVPATTVADWGTIWDELPAGFPHYPGAEPAETGAGPASAELAIPATAPVAADWYRQALKKAGYETEAVSGPLEDGGFVIESVGAETDCRVQISLVPEGDQSIATILVAAACPFS